MTTLTVNTNSAEALTFLDFARTLPFVNVENEDECPICKNANYRLRPEVERSIRRSMQGIDVVACDSMEEMFKDLGI